ncbi:MAG TPA: WecB/TagA/CpsF family glycosyltransferase [Actinomycetota bacterium]|nr:WecB/TagA/CpsF family glycosyltransferase [Actinomycetota bacterium]
MDRVIDHGKKSVLGVRVDALDYDAAAERIVRAASEGRGYAVSALAVHGVMTGVGDPEHLYRLNSFDLLTPDGQPVRWALNALHETGLRDRVYGPTLTLRLCERAAADDIPVFFYGSRPEVLRALEENLVARFPGLRIAGTEPSKFRTTTSEEQVEIANRIKASGARITFVGLGCPRQEVFAYEYRDLLSMPVIAVGAAFDYHSGAAKEPPMWVQRMGLQWLHRLVRDPRRLWRRYLVLNVAFVARLAAQRLRIWDPDATSGAPPSRPVLYG